MKAQETRNFQSEVKQLLNLMINSLYSDKEIFLRELISNASDAADKLRFHALSKPGMYEEDKNIHVRISIDKEKRLLIVDDNAIGMCRNEVIENLGTIAKSGTKSFIQSLKSTVSNKNKLIGQFGVGFYSIFMIADKVTVRTRAAEAPFDKAVFWESTGEGSYTIADIKKINRGTEITLHLRDGEDEFLDPWRLRNIISKYSNYINLPIEMPCINKPEEWEKVNKAQALWTINKSQISELEYKAFYKHITNDFHDPIIWSHNRVEGKQEYTSLLYIPSHAPLNLWNRDSKHSLKLYVQRIFITDDLNTLLPNYFRFVQGLIDCNNNLPLNISREILQNNRIVQNLRVALTKRVFQMLQKLQEDPNKYNQFWKIFGLVLKEGPAEDSDNIKNIMPLLRFASTHSNVSNQTVSLKEYIKRMIPNQEKIYYLTADSYTAASSSPHIEVLRKKGIEILLLSDRIDEWMMSNLTSFEGKSFHPVSKSDESLNKLINDNDSDYKNTNNTSFKFFIERVKNILNNRVKDVRLTNRLLETPAILTTEANDMSTQMAKIFAAVGQKVPEIKYILELNPKHPLIKKTIEITDETLFVELIEFLLDQALLTEIGSLKDLNKFIRRVNNLILKSNMI
ncbi:MAG: molecular chaperone HtpG [Candidatus Dasytiphilus stammeri]